jgi:4-hydroxybenzoate polyprenyltransferase
MSSAIVHRELRSTREAAIAALPLCVDLDGCLTATDTFAESIILAFKTAPFQTLLCLLRLVISSKASVKDKISRIARPDATQLPYHGEFLRYLRSEAARGRDLYLVTGAHERIAQDIVAQLGIFRGCISTHGDINVIGKAKARILVDTFGLKGFVYAGNSTTDMPVWRAAAEAIAVNGGHPVRRKLVQLDYPTRIFAAPSSTWRALLQAIRPYQWVKNILVLVPLVTSHRLFEANLVGRTALAFLAFCMCASGGYLMNDLLDIETDRRNPSKRNRPFASGRLTPAMGMIVGLGLTAASIALAAWLSFGFCLIVLAYVALTTAYCCFFRAKMFADVIALTLLYCLRLLGGHIVCGIAASNWLIATSLFTFLGLALMKRYTEVRFLLDENPDAPSGRAYMPSDLPILQMIGIVSSFAAVLVLALYIDSTAALHYRSPQFLWIWCLLLLYYMSRVWMIANRKKMSVDPVQFAIRDRVAYVTIAAGLCVYALASYVVI